MQSGSTQYGIAVEAGRFTAQRIEYDDAGRSTVTDLAPSRASGAEAVADIRQHEPSYQPHPAAAKLYGLA